MVADIMCFRNICIITVVIIIIYSLLLNVSMWMLQLLLGTKVGSVRVFDIKEKKVIKDVVTDTTCPR